MTKFNRRGAACRACLGSGRSKRRPYTLLSLFFCVLAPACSGHAAADAAADTQATTPTCHEKQKKADGTCCPTGQAYEFRSDTCFAVDPPECAEVIFNNPEKCVPKWCWDWQDADKALSNNNSIDPMRRRSRESASVSLATQQNC